jgi:hypothetical protein
VSPNRIVVLLTPLVFAPLAGFISLKLADLGINLSSSRAQDIIVQGAIFLGGVIIAFLKSRKWLQGWQDFEKRQDWLVNSQLDDRFTKFLEELAAKSGVDLPGPDALPLATGDAPGDPPPAFAPGAMRGPDAAE